MPAHYCHAGQGSRVCLQRRQLCAARCPGVLRCRRVGAGARGCIVPGSARLLLPVDPAGEKFGGVQVAGVADPPALAVLPASPPPCIAAILSSALCWCPYSLSCSAFPAPSSPQIKEELASVKAQRPTVIVAQPALHLDLPKALQQPPSRLDMCSKCADWIEKVGRLGRVWCCR